jgi:hypothetical protein
MPRQLQPKKTPPLSTRYETSNPHSRSGRCGAERTLQRRANCAARFREAAHVMEVMRLRLHSSDRDRSLEPYMGSNSTDWR